MTLPRWRGMASWMCCWRIRSCLVGAAQLDGGTQRRTLSAYAVAQGLAVIPLSLAVRPATPPSGVALHRRGMKSARRAAAAPHALSAVAAQPDGSTSPSRCRLKPVRWVRCRAATLCHVVPTVPPCWLSAEEGSASVLPWSAAHPATVRAAEFATRPNRPRSGRDPRCRGCPRPRRPNRGHPPPPT